MEIMVTSIVVTWNAEGRSVTWKVMATLKPHMVGAALRRPRRVHGGHEL
jgi:hypothetical protein